jgi:hypothetical protein
MVIVVILVHVFIAFIVLRVVIKLLKKMEVN